MDILLKDKKQPLVLKVLWSHFNVDKTKLSTRISEDESLRKDRSGKTYTVCVLRGRLCQAYGCVIDSRNTAEGELFTVGTGEAIVHPRDKFDADKGRKIALTRALEVADVPRGHRIKIWNKYFGK